MLDVNIPQRVVTNARPEDAATGIWRVEVSEGRVATLEDDRSCRECHGTGWVLYRSETVEGGFEEAYRLCPEGHAPRYCMGSRNGGLCPRPGVVRCGEGYYCEEHAAYPAEYPRRRA